MWVLVSGSNNSRRPPSKRTGPRPVPASSAAVKRAAKPAPANKRAAKPAPAKKGRPASTTSTQRRSTAQLPGPKSPKRPVKERERLPKTTRSAARFTELVTGNVPVVKVQQNQDQVQARKKVEAQLAAQARDYSEFRKRYGVVHNTQGPRMRLGVLWALVVTLSLAYGPLRPYGLATVYAVAAGLAALQVVDAWHEVRVGSDRITAALGASLLPVAATVGTQWLGGGILALVGLALGSAIARPRDDRDMPVLAAAGHTVFAAASCGGAAASLVLLANYEIGAVIILIVYLMAYDASDYVVGSGSSNGLLGPIAGGLMVCACTAFLAVLEVPPFRGADIWLFALIAVFALPVGQIVASSMLPRPDANAPALRRLDSLLVVAPAWAGLIGLYIQQAR